MPKATKAGASAAVPKQVVRKVLQMHAEGQSLADIRQHLNRQAVLLADHAGHPRVGIWSDQAVRELLARHGAAA